MARISFASDEANTKYEKKLDRVYHEYNVAPTDQGLWDFVQSQSGKKSYKTQKGDTLWDLSDMIFGDPNYWPKVWSLNKNIQDPHAVPPGTLLSFASGSVDEAASVSIFGVPDWTPPAEARPEVMSHTLNAEIPYPERESKPLLNEFPSSLPSWKFTSQNDVKVESKIDISARTVKAASPLKYLENYISDKSTDPDGEIVGTELGMSTASEFQYVFVKMNNPQHKKYIVVNDAGKIKDTYSGKKGQVVEVLGEVEISEIVDPEKHTYRAIVKKSVGQIRKGSKLIYAELPTYRFDDSGTIGSLDARIIGGRFGLERRIFGPDSIVYLNLGNSGGVSPGMILPIFEYQLGPTNSDLVKVNPRPIGKMKVVKTSAEFSTAVILESNREIQIGDGTSRMTHTSAVQESESTNEPSSEAPVERVEAPPVETPAELPTVPEAPAESPAPTPSTPVDEAPPEF